MAEDWYVCFAELKAAEQYGKGYRIRCTGRGSGIAVIAPHGGKIEPGSSQVAAAIAGRRFDLYRFEGLKRWPHCRLHITSTLFDEPKCLRLIETCAVVVSVHGLQATGAGIDLGGRDGALRDVICVALGEAGFAARVVTIGGHAARDASNICNRGATGAGVQLEIERGLRDRLRRDRSRMTAFAGAIRSVIETRQRSGLR